jgi:histone-lysine N-methyltransferase SETMAR
VQKSDGKGLTSIFWDQEGIFLIDYIPKGKTTNTEYYSSLLVGLKGILKEKQHGKVTNGILFSKSKAPTHWALQTQKKLEYLGFHHLDYRPYSMDLAPLDYHLFPGLKKQMKARHFSSDMEVTAVAETWLVRQHSDFFLSGLQKLEQSAKMRTELRGECVE